MGVTINRKFVEQHRPLVRRIIRRRLSGREHLIDDAEQETWLRAFRSADDYDPARSRITTWLSILAHHATIDELRKYYRRSRITKKAPDHSVPLTSECVGPNLAPPIHEYDALHDAMARLPDREAEVLMLTYGRGLSYRDAATAMNLNSIGTVKSLHHRARTMLRPLRFRMENGR